MSSLKNGVDLFLSEDFHFTSKITESVINDIKNVACQEYRQMCNSNLYSIDANIFLKAYYSGKININLARSMMQEIRKPDKSLKSY